MAKDRTASDGTANDPGADTEMFQAFVDRSNTYEARPAPKGPLVVAGVALALAVLGFFLILATR
jgi:hypothetical protein